MKNLDRKTAEKIIADYDALVERALTVTRYTPFYSSVDSDDDPRISFEGDDLVMRWTEYESDYYGGGSTRRETSNFPADALFMTDAELQANQDRIKKDEAEKAARLRKAQEAVARDRAEAHDRAEWARLRAKFGER